jgi:hypothetical protein
MSGSSRSRQKRKLEPISLEELAGTTGMSGFCTFLTRDTSVPVPALESLQPAGAAPAAALAPIENSASESSAPELSASALSAPQPLASIPTAPITTAPVSDASVSNAVETSAVDSSPIPPSPRPSHLHALKTRALETSAPSSPASDMSASDFDASDSGALDTPFHRRIRIRETATVQDGHSLAEQAVYDAMYRAGKPYQADSRLLTIGLRTLAELSRMAYSNCKANVRSLVEKLAIDESEEFSYTEGRTYVVYSFREILRRRKAAGLTHVIRTRGVAFVDPVTGKPLKGISLLESSAPDSNAPEPSAPDPVQGAFAPSKPGAPEDRQSSAPAPAALIKNSHWMRHSGQASSSAVDAIVAALRSHIPDVDDEAAALLWQRCRANAPAASAGEIVHFIHLKAGKPGIRMPLGFLLTAVPKCFLGDSYRQFREERERALAGHAARDRKFAEEILKSPEADEEQREWAREVLGIH